MQILNYWNVLRFENPEIWVEKIANRCPGSLNSAFQNRCLASFGNTALVFGVLWGILMQAWLTPGIISGTVPASDSIKHKILRYAIPFVLGYPWYRMQWWLWSWKFNMYVQLFFSVTFTNVM